MSKTTKIVGFLVNYEWKNSHLCLIPLRPSTFPVFTNRHEAGFPPFFQSFPACCSPGVKEAGAEQRQAVSLRLYDRQPLLLII